MRILIVMVNLIYDLYLNFADLVLGVKRSPTLEGRVKIKIPEGT